MGGKQEHDIIHVEADTHTSLGKERGDKQEQRVIEVEDAYSEKVADVGSTNKGTDSKAASERSIHNSPSKMVEGGLGNELLDEEDPPNIHKGILQGTLMQMYLLLLRKGTCHPGRYCV